MFHSIRRFLPEVQISLQIRSRVAFVHPAIPVKEAQATQEV